MQIIFQDPYSSLNPRMSVSEIIMEPLQLKGGMSHAEMYEKTKKLMDTVVWRPDWKMRIRMNWTEAEDSELESRVHCIKSTLYRL